MRSAPRVTRARVPCRARELRAARRRSAAMLILPRRRLTRKMPADTPIAAADFADAAYAHIAAAASCHSPRH